MSDGTYADKKGKSYYIIHVFSTSKSFSSKKKTSQRKNSKLQMTERHSKQPGLPYDPLWQVRTEKTASTQTEELKYPKPNRAVIRV